jgi:hypothetical protein
MARRPPSRSATKTLNPIAVATNKPRRFSGGAWFFIARWLSLNAYIVAPERVSPDGGSPAARKETYRKVEETE